MLTVPEGMSMAQFNEHPVRQMIRAAAYAGAHGLPSRHELDALELSPALRKRVRDACHTVAEIHATGEQSDAWNRGDEYAVEIVDELPEEMRDPHWFDAPPPAALSERDPAALAALVPRAGQ
ncbi:MAG: hypothetical protein JWM06_1687 [Actinomycetia bacterium]|jgi:hypothetical protein|nr:hypothetical protein [Actinomycetes bacterium]